MTDGFEDVVEREAPRVLGALVRRYGSVADCEDALQTALLDAWKQRPTEGVPADPRAWLTTVARRRLIDDIRTQTARRERELTQLAELPLLVDPFTREGSGGDNTLKSLLLCADPALSSASQVALTLRVLSGLTTGQIAAAFFVPERTMGQRISRAKTALRHAGIDFRNEVVATDQRLTAVRHVLYLVFNEGYTRSSGETLVNVSLTTEAIRLTRQLHRATPGDTETMGLLALMLITHSRAPCRTDDHGDLIALAEQNRSRWNHALIVEGVGLVERALVLDPVGPFQIQAAIAAIHAEATTWQDTDWPQILVLYQILERLNPSGTVRLNLAVATAMTDATARGLDITRDLLDDPVMARNHRTHAVHAHLLSMEGAHPEAATFFSHAATLTTSVPEQRYLLRMAAIEEVGAC